MEELKQLPHDTQIVLILSIATVCGIFIWQFWKTIREH